MTSLSNDSNEGSFRIWQSIFKRQVTSSEALFSINITHTLMIIANRILLGYCIEHNSISMEKKCIMSSRYFTICYRDFKVHLKSLIAVGWSCIFTVKMELQAYHLLLFCIKPFYKSWFSKTANQLSLIAHFKKKNETKSLFPLSLASRFNLFQWYEKIKKKSTEATTKQI